ncbi:MAG: hypothetical protein QXW75_01395 [Thermoplasmatales archaeon]
MTVGDLQRMLYVEAKAEPEKRLHSLYDKIQRTDVLNEAWEFVRRNRGSPGIAGRTIEETKEQGVETPLNEIQSELGTKTYIPLPLKRMYIPKANGQYRLRSIPIVRDRIKQTAIKLIVKPISKTQFESYSLGFGPDKSAHNAVDEIVKYLNFGCENIIDAYHSLFRQYRQA